MVKMVGISTLMDACFKEQAALQVLNDFRRYLLNEKIMHDNSTWSATIDLHVAKD